MTRKLVSVALVGGLFATVGACSTEVDTKEKSFGVPKPTPIGDADPSSSANKAGADAGAGTSQQRSDDGPQDNGGHDEFSSSQTTADKGMPTATAAPVVTADPVVTAMPVVTPAPVVAATPVATAAVVASPKPAVTSVPTAAPVVGPVSHVMARSSTSQALQIWRLDSAGKILAQTPITAGAFGVDARPLNSPGWDYLGNGDLDGDGKQDLFFHYRSGSDAIQSPVLVLFMDGTKAMRSQVINANVDWRYTGFGVGDVNRDGIPDLYWRHSTTGGLAYWLLSRDGTAKGSTLLSPTGTAQIVADPNWLAVDVADLERNGTFQPVWFYQPTGRLMAWRMNGGTLSASYDVVSDALLGGGSYVYGGAVNLKNEAKLRVLFHNRSLQAAAPTRGELRFVYPAAALPTVLSPSVTDFSWRILKGTSISAP